MAHTNLDTRPRGDAKAKLLDAALAVVCGVAIPFMMFTRQSHSIDQMTAVWTFVGVLVTAVEGPRPRDRSGHRTHHDQLQRS